MKSYTANKNHPPCLIKIHLVKALLIGCLLAGGASVRADEPVLIGREIGNGDFEAASLEGWLDLKDKGGALEEIKNSPKNGKQVFHVKLKGTPNERAVARLYQNIANVDPSKGHGFVLKFDARAVTGHLVPNIAVEMVLFDDSGNVVQTVLFDQPESASPEWQTRSLNAVDGANKTWSGGKIQFRLLFLMDNGEEGESYEMLIDNVQLTQK